MFRGCQSAYVNSPVLESRRFIRMIPANCLKNPVPAFLWKDHFKFPFRNLFNFSGRSKKGGGSFQRPELAGTPCHPAAGIVRTDFSGTSGKKSLFQNIQMRFGDVNIQPEKRCFFRCHLWKILSKRSSQNILRIFTINNSLQISRICSGCCFPVLPLLLCTGRSGRGRKCFAENFMALRSSG